VNRTVADAGIIRKRHIDDLKTRSIDDLKTRSIAASFNRTISDSEQVIMADEVS
jgi:hypothetical protein